MSASATGTATGEDTLDTPILEAEKNRLLQRITEEGGYAYVSMAMLASGGDIRAAEAAREMAWEQLHSGPWHSVVPVWRDAYAMACLHVAKLHYAAGEFSLAIRALDMGLIMGGLTLRDDLNSAIQKASRKASLPVATASSQLHAGAAAAAGDKICKIISGDVDMAEVGKNYLCAEWKQELITFSDFLERIQSNAFTSGDTTYLAQHPLFDQIQELRQDIVIPDYCFVGGGELRSVNVWFGPASTVTPLHHDPHHNILAQVVGKKYIRLYSASLSEELYPHEESMLRNSSQVDLDNIDEKEFPKVRDLEFVDCILEEGEMIYIPPKWWHYVRSLTTSFSVSFWWSESSNASSSAS